MNKSQQIISSIIGNQTYTWIVTGAAGFIGSHLCESLLALNQKVKGIDNFSTGKLGNIDYLNSLDNAKNFSFTDADINDKAKLNDVFKGVDFVLHQAALGSVPRSIEDPATTHESNVNGFLGVFDLARENSIKKIVYASSSSVYGDSPELPKKEDVIGHVLSPYAASKLCNEIYADAYTCNYSIQAVALRYFNVFGPRQDPNGPYAAVIPRWADALSKSEQCEIYGDGETSRDFCYVENVVLANLLSALNEKQENPHQVYNVACGERTTLNELYNFISEEISDITGNEKIKVNYKPFREGDIRHSHADISKISRELGYEPVCFIQEGLKRTIPSFI